MNGEFGRAAFGGGVGTGCARFVGTREPDFKSGWTELRWWRASSLRDAAGGGGDEKKET